MVGVKPPSYNLFWNAAFNGLNETGMDLPGWTFNIGKLAATYDLTHTQLFHDHNILQLTYVGSGSPGELRPTTIPKSPIHSFVSFGVYAQFSVAGSIAAAMKYETGSTIASSEHTGSGKWEFIGMSSLYDKSGGALPYFVIKGDVNISAPIFVYGHSQVSPGADFISSSGARMSGSFTMNVIGVLPQTDVPSDQWVLPIEGNIFDIQPFADTGGASCSTTYKDVRRFNYNSPRFEKGCIITVLFPACGGCVPCLAIKNNAFISLLGGTDFSPDPSSVNASIMLMSKGKGTWREISRNGFE